MSEEEKINQSTGNSQQSTEENKTVEQPLTINNEPITNMEVHHHPHVAKKKFKEYFLEFLMIFLAVTLGFFAENIREHFSDKDKGQHFIENLIADLQVDTAELRHNINYNSVQSNMLDSAFEIPAERLANINVQDTFFHYVFLYYSYVPAFSPSMNTISELKAGGFNVMHDQSTIDSINSIYQFYDREVNFDTKYDQDVYWDVSHKMQAMMQLPQPAVSWNDLSTRIIPVNQRIFLKTDEVTITQLYNVIGNSISSLKTIINAEANALEKVTALIKYLKVRYNLQ